MKKNILPFLLSNNKKFTSESALPFSDRNNYKESRLGNSRECKGSEITCRPIRRFFCAIFFCLFAVGLTGQTCFPDTLLLTSQEEIDNFPIDYPDCTEVLGHVLIQEAIPGDITNLNGLNQLTFVSRHLIIRDNVALANLSGLGNLEMVGVFYVLNNSSLNSFIGLESLHTIKREELSSIFGYFIIEDNPSLVNFEGLQSLEHIDKFLRIGNNESLLDLSGLNALNSSKNLSIRDCPSFQGLGNNMFSLNANSISYIHIRNCDNLIDMSGLEEFTRLNTLELRSNDDLVGLNGLENLDTLSSLRLESNPLLQNIDALSGLEDLSGLIDIGYNNSLVSIAALQVNSDSLAGLYIRGNPALVSLTGLSSYEVTGSLTIGENESLIDFTGLEGLREIRFDAEIYANEALQNCNGLQNLEEAKRLFHWNSNTSLTSFTGLSSLKKIGGLFWMRNHPNVIDLTGLEQLDTIGHGLWIGYMDNLQSLDGLEGLEYLGGESNFAGGTFEGSFDLSSNSQLSDISAIAGASTEGIKNMGIGNNPLLEVCSYPNICSYALTGRPITITNNALGCDNKGQLLQGCFADLAHSNIVGAVSADIDLDCEIANDGLVPNVIISFENDSLDWQINTDETGEYWMPLLLGEWTATPVSPSSFWVPCTTDTLLNISAQGDTIRVDFPLQPLGDCSYIEWDLSAGDMRICESNTFVIDFCNYGTSIAEDLIITVSLDTFLTFENSTTPHTIDAEGNIFFPIDSLALFECDQLSFSAFVDCDSLDIWDVQCVEVSLLSEALCPSDSLWDGSIIKVGGYCENDSIYFELKNIGTGDMFEPAQFRVEIVIDDIILFLNVDDYQLEVDDTKLLAFAANNSVGMRMEADQSSGFPGAKQASVVVANCEAAENNEIYILLPNGEDGDPFNEVFCEPVVSSFDPNDKSAVPEGLTYEHLIDRDWILDYRIRFQNTGNAPANKVVIRDALSDNLDLSTLEVKGASHSFTWELMPGRELVFTFDNIMLPDSNANEPASHGFVSFAVQPKTTLLPGTEIENFAGIYFDFNEPIITNKVKHKLRKPIVTTSAHQPFCIGDSLMGIPIWADTIFQFLTEGDLYDSIHVLHLDVVPSSVSNIVDIVLPIGEILEGVEITGDTTFVVEYENQYGCDSLVTYHVEGLVATQNPVDNFNQTIVYPNPVADKLYILHNENGLDQTWRLCNILGQEVWQKNLGSDESLAVIDVGGISSGIYLLEARTEISKRIWKILVE